MRSLRAFLVVASLLAATPAHAAATDKRAPVKVDVSPREAFGAYVVVRLRGSQVGFKGDDDQDALARVSEALDFKGIKDAVRAKPGGSAMPTDFSDRQKVRTIARDDLERLVKWIGETALDEDTNSIVNGLKDRFQRAIDGK